MASTKRKAPEKASKEPTKYSKDRSERRPAKRPRKDESQTKSKSSKSQDVSETTTERNLPRVSLLKEEDRSFPRGGGGILTPFEHKQIQVQATKDVLFEESGQKRPQTGSDSEEEMSDQKGQTQQIRQKNRKIKTQSKDRKDEKEPSVHIASLKTKNLVPGCLVLGQISRISAQELFLDLPNNLIGTVPITNISQKLNARLEALADEEEDAEDDKSDIESSIDVDLKSMFLRGQFLRASVTAEEPDSEGKDSQKSRKKTIMSIDPRATNGRLSTSDIPVWSTVQASVASVEDHGLIMDPGLENKNVKGFLAKKEIPKDMQYSEIQEGAVFLCIVTGLSSNGKVLKLSANHKTAGDLRKGNVLLESATIDPLLPGTAAEVLLSQVDETSVAGKIMGLVDASVDMVHSGSTSGVANLQSKYKPAAKVTSRIIFTRPHGEALTVGVSLLKNVLWFSDSAADSTGALPLSSVVEEAKVVNVDPSLGLYFDLGSKRPLGFVHISRVSDERVTDLPASIGPYKIGTTHRVRILGFNSIDSLYLLSMEKSVLDQPFLRVEDVDVGEIVKGTVEKIMINPDGVGGVLIKLAQGISGLAPEIHMADVQLQHPERKFKPGAKVTARVLSTDTESRRIRLTLKKTLVNTDKNIWTSFAAVHPGMETVGTISKVHSKGAAVQFFGDVRGFLPQSEMSDSYIADPTQHFRIGQVVSVQAKEVDADNKRIILSSRTTSALDATQEAELMSLKAGVVVSGKVIDKSADDITLELIQSRLKATLRLGHLSDGSEQKNMSTMKQMREGQTLKDLVVIEVNRMKRAVLLSSKASLVRAAKANSLVDDVGKLSLNQNVDGFVQNVTEEGIFVRLAGGITGLIPKSQIPEETSKLPGFDMAKDKSIRARVIFTDLEQKRFALSLKDPPKEDLKPAAVSDGAEEHESHTKVENPVDGKSTTMSGFALGNLTQARVTSIKDTQLNVQLADSVQGRIDASELFSSWDQIKDRKTPLRSYHVKQVIPVKVLGLHDARNHRFLPISHRAGKVPVFELSAKTDENASVLSFDQLAVGTSHIGFVNNHGDNCLWVNLSPNVRGRIARMDISDDVSLLNDLENNFPKGSALQVHVKNIDASNGRLDLSSKPVSQEGELKLDDLSTGTVIAGRVTKVSERSIMVQLSATVSGQVPLTDIADDFEQADPTAYQKNAIVRVCVTEMDKPNKKVWLSTRPSKVLSSSLPVKDRQISSVTQLKIGSVVRGFIKNVADVGLFISLSHSVTAFVRVAEMADTYMKDWKSNFEIDRLVKGKVISVGDKDVQLSLKPSVVSDDYVPPITFSDLTEGEIVTGKIRKVEDFGAFIVVDNSHNVSGLCHRSEVADKWVPDVRKLYNEGDLVKAKVLKIEPEKRRISFGLKASYFKDDEDEDGEDDSDIDMAEEGPELGLDGDGSEDEESDDDEEGGVELDLNGLLSRSKTGETGGGSSDDEDNEDNNELFAERRHATKTSTEDISGLDVGGFNWTGTVSHPGDVSDAESTTSSTANGPTKKKKHRKPTIKTDHTADLHIYGPRTSSDFERLLLTQPSSSSLWIQYMAHHIELSDIDAARALADRALRTIPIRAQDAKQAVWLALLNLEDAYGDAATLDAAFARACEYNDRDEMRERLAGIFVASGKIDKADETFQALLSGKRASGKRTASASAPNQKPDLWLRYARFLMDGANSPGRARELLSRALQAVPKHLQRELVTRFAGLEFRCRNGDAERGRTVFEGLVETYPRKGEVWDAYVDAERVVGERRKARTLFERMIAGNGRGMKRRRAERVFAMWMRFEAEGGDAEGKKNADMVKRKEKEWFEQYGKADVADGDGNEAGD